jgi:hypothetical protein
MAGAGYKLFATGDVLTAAQVNTFLMQQTVMVFASSTARTTALSGVVSEGMLTYLLDTNSLEYYDGAAFQPVSNPGDITSVGVTSPITGGGTSGAVTIAIQDGTTAQKGAVQLENSTSSTSTTTAAVPANVKTAYDLADGAIAKTTVTTAGDVIYRNATVPTRLGIGTAGQVLTVNTGATAPEWKTPSGGSGLTLISTTTMSNVSSQEIAGCFSSTYTNYLVVFSDLYASATNTTPRIQMMYSTNTVQSGGYYGGLCGFNYSGTANSDNVANTYSQTYYTLPGLADTTLSGATMTFFAPNTGVNKAPFNIDWASQYFGWRYVGMGAQNTSRAYTGFKLTTAANNIYGTISVYGMAK